MIDGLVYLDTNIYSKLAKQTDSQDALELKAKCLDKGMKPILSPINVIEILNTRDPLQREKIISFCQHFCVREMLAEPEDLIVDFICSNHSLKMTECFVKNTQLGSSEVSKAWIDIYENKEKTFLISKNSLKQINYFKIFQGYLHAFYSRGNRLNDLNLPSPLSCSDIESYEELLKSETRKLRRSPVPKDRIAALCENRQLATLILVCSCMTPFPQTLERYWHVLGLVSVAERLEYVETHLSFIDESGPIVAIGSLMGWQATKGHDNGNFFDCLHLMYLPYVSKFFTDDPAFHQFKEAYPNAGLLIKIFSSKELFD